jgi:hypothetical protein
MLPDIATWHRQVALRNQLRFERFPSEATSSMTFALLLPRDHSKSREVQHMATTGPGSGQTTTGQLASDATRLVRDTAYTQIDNQKHRATDMLGNLARAVRSSSGQMHEGDASFIAGYADRAADQIDRLSEAIRNRELDDLARDVRRFAKERPALFLGAAFGLGLLTARFLKSSGERIHPEERSMGQEGAGALATAHPAGGATTRPYVAHDVAQAAPETSSAARTEVDKSKKTNVYREG